MKKFFAEPRDRIEPGNTKNSLCVSTNYSIKMALNIIHTRIRKSLEMRKLEGFCPNLFSQTGKEATRNASPVCSCPSYWLLVTTFFRPAKFKFYIE